MASTYSTDLKLELMATGENAGTWGTKTNANLNLIQQAIAGYELITLTDGATTALVMNNASISNARNMVLKFATITLTSATTVTIPDSIEKFYIFDCSLITNPTNLTIKTATGTGFTLDSNKIYAAYADGTNLNEVSLDTLGGTVGTTQIANDAVTNDKVAADAIDTVQIVDDAVTNAKVAADAIDTVQLVDDAVTQAKIANNAVGPDQLTNDAVIPSGTIMLFQQTAAPTGFTKLTSQNNKALRVVSGTASTGGSNSFTDAFNSTKTVSGTTGSSSVSISGSTASHTLSVSEIPSHTHTKPAWQMTAGIRHQDGTDYIPQRGDQGGPSGTFTMSSTGGGGGHSHGAGTLSGGSHSHSFSDTFNLNVQYVDIILASKD